MLIIPLPHRDPLKRERWYVRDELVRACATGAAFIGERRLVVTGLAGCSMYLYEVDMDSGTAKLLDSRMTTDELNGSICFTDLVDFDGRDLLACSNMELSTQTLYRVRDDRLEVYKTVPAATPDRKFCHGVAFDPYRESVIGTANFDVSQVEFLDYEREKLLMKIPFPRRVRPKDLAWVDADHVLVAHTTSRVERRPVEEVPHSALALFRIDLASGRYRRLRSEPIKESHVDCVIFQRGLVFTSTQDSHQVYVHRLFRKGRLRRAWRFERIAVLEGYDRPHGLAFHAESGLLAATNYGDNTVRIRRLDDAILARMEPAS